MQKTSTFLTFAALALLGSNAHSQDLTSINVGATLPEYTFNSSSNEINLQMTVRNVGYFNSDPFEVSVFLKDVNSSAEYEIDRVTESGLSYSQLNNGNTSEIQNWSIDLDNKSQVPGGTFRLEARINDDNSTTETNYSNNNENFGNATFVYNKTSVGINDAIENASISTYPNPAQNQLFFNQETEKEATIVIFDLLGNNIKTINTNQKLTEVNISDLKNGIYLYQLISDDTELIASGKFTKI